MISAVTWEWSDDADAYVAELGAPRRMLAIRWDPVDRGWFLAVTVPARPESMGQPATQPRAYVTPMPLLVAMTLLPPEHHGQLRDRVEEAARIAQGDVLAHMQTVVANVVEDWPATVRAREGVRDAGPHMEDVERLSLDLAAAGAWED